MKKNLIILFFLIILVVGLISLYELVLNVDKLRTDYFLNKGLTKAQIQNNNENFIIQKVIISFNIILKILLIYGIIFFSCYLSKVKITSAKIFEICIKSEYVFVLPILFEITYFKIFISNYDYEIIKKFSSLSLINFFEYKELDAWWHYPLQTINFFEILYVLFLSYLIGKEIGNFKKGLKIVCSSYVPALLLWIVVVMFFTLNNS